MHQDIFKKIDHVIIISLALVWTMTERPSVDANTTFRYMKTTDWN